MKILWAANFILSFELKPYANHEISRGTNLPPLAFESPQKPGLNRVNAITKINRLYSIND